MLGPRTQAWVASASGPPGCPKDVHVYERAHLDSDYSSDGALAGWQIRDTNAPDWEAWGFAGQTLWYGTDGNINLNWIEVGTSDGWRGANAKVFYSAGMLGGADYEEHSWSALTPQLNHYATFKILHANNGDMKASVTDETTFVQVTRLYGGHAGPFPEWAIGSETTCPGGGGEFIDKTYVYDDEYRRKSDHLWFNADSGTLQTDGNTNSGAGWCYLHVLFRYWLNDFTNAGCS